MKPSNGKPEGSLRGAAPDSERRVRAHGLALCLLFVGLVVLYAATTCPTVYPGDSGELIAAAFSLGVPHNSGYPLYALLGKASSLLPLGSVGYRLNLLSCLTVVAAVVLLAAMVQDWTGSRGIALSAALFLAFSAKVWAQSGSAEVYGLHLFFVVLLLWLLFLWDRDRRWWHLALLASASGLSFGNHLQTVMLAPGILWVILARDRDALLRPKAFLPLALLFCVPLVIYAYLPLRTAAGAAITWGDPDTWERFWAHVTATSHRHGYVFNQTLHEYGQRLLTAVTEIRMDFGLLLLPAAWGWWKIDETRWKVFFVLILAFDMIYTVFLNTVSLSITPFSLHTYVALTVLLALGIQHVLKAAARLPSTGPGLQRVFEAALCILPIIPLAANLDRCDQHRNYAAYEHATNLFRTLDVEDILIMDGDNHVFPVAYGRIAERAREDVRLFDRHNVVFKFTGLRGLAEPEETWDSLRKKMIRKIIASSGASREVFYAVFSPHGVELPKPYTLQPFGLLHRAVSGKAQTGLTGLHDPWPSYIDESVYDSFFKDYMSREICAFYSFSKGKHAFRMGRPDLGLAAFRIASHIGYDDQLIHSEMGVFLTGMGRYEEAARELEIASVHHENLRVVYNNWGYYYQRIGDFANAAKAFRKVLELAPESVADHNNLGFVLFEMGKKEEARRILQKSLSIDAQQPEIERFIARNLPVSGLPSLPQKRR